MQQKSSLSKQFKKGVLAGLGMMSLTKKQVEKSMNDMAKKSGLSQKEGEKIAKEFIGKIEKNKNNMSKELDRAIERTLKKMNMPTRKEMDQLKRKVDRLERKTAKK